MPTPKYFSKYRPEQERIRAYKREVNAKAAEPYADRGARAAVGGLIGGAGGALIGAAHYSRGKAANGLPLVGGVIGAGLGAGIGYLSGVAHDHDVNTARGIRRRGDYKRSLRSAFATYHEDREDQDRRDIRAAGSRARREDFNDIFRPRRQSTTYTIKLGSRAGESHKDEYIQQGITAGVGGGVAMGAGLSMPSSKEIKKVDESIAAAKKEVGERSAFRDMYSKYKGELSAEEADINAAKKSAEESAKQTAEEATKQTDAKPKTVRERIKNVFSRKPKQAPTQVNVNVAPSRIGEDFSKNEAAAKESLSKAKKLRQELGDKRMMRGGLAVAGAGAGIYGAKKLYDLLNQEKSAMFYETLQMKKVAKLDITGLFTNDNPELLQKQFAQGNFKMIQPEFRAEVEKLFNDAGGDFSKMQKNYNAAEAARKAAEHQEAAAQMNKVKKPMSMGKKVGFGLAGAAGLYGGAKLMQGMFGDKKQQNPAQPAPMGMGKSAARMTFKNDYDDNPLLRGGQSRLPDSLQKKIIVSKLKSRVAKRSRASS